MSKIGNSYKTTYFTERNFSMDYMERKKHHYKLKQ